MWWHPYNVGGDSSEYAYIEAFRHATSRENIDFSTNQGHNVRFDSATRAWASARVLQRYEAIKGHIALRLCRRGSVFKSDDVRDCHCWRGDELKYSGVGMVRRFIFVDY